MMKIIFKIREICYDHGLFIDHGQACLAIIVEYCISNGNRDRIRDVLFEYVDYFPVDITQASEKIVNYLHNIELATCGCNYVDAENGSWIEFVIDDKHWKIYFTLVSGYSDYVGGRYLLVDRMAEVR
jgi:hypothetical protein